MKGYHIGRRSPMLNQSIGTVESDIQYQIRYQVEESKTESHLWTQYGK